MVATLNYRTADNSRWGGGLGSNLSAVQVDLNFWNLFTAMEAVEDQIADVGAGIDFINQPAAGNLFFIHLTDHRVLGPFTIPTAQWNPRGEWQPDTAYAAYDVVAHNGSLYLIVVPHTSGATFSPFSTDGMGHLLYNLLLEQPADELPDGGTIGQRLVKASGSPFVTEWRSDFVRMALFVGGQPNPSEMLLQFNVTDEMTIPQGLTNSVFFANTPTASDVTYNIFKNGANVGSITFQASPEDVDVAFPSNVLCVPGDIITLIAPAVPDATQSDISFTLVANLT